MPRKKEPVEVEIKLSVRSAAQARKLLREHGYVVEKPRIFEQNIVLDDEQMTLFETGRMLRVRRAGKKVTCTSKGPENTGKHKRRVENEFTASDFDSAVALFGAIGFKERFRYEKFRTEYTRKGEPGTVTIDETPIGTFMEIEGPPGWIDASAKSLGFGREAYITQSYAALYFLWCEEQGIKPGSMTF